MRAASSAGTLARHVSFVLVLWLGLLTFHQCQTWLRGLPLRLSALGLSGSPRRQCYTMREPKAGIIYVSTIERGGPVAVAGNSRQACYWLLLRGRRRTRALDAGGDKNSDSDQLSMQASNGGLSPEFCMWKRELLGSNWLEPLCKWELSGNLDFIAIIVWEGEAGC